MCSDSWRKYYCEILLCMYRQKESKCVLIHRREKPLCVSRQKGKTSVLRYTLWQINKFTETRGKVNVFFFVSRKTEKLTQK